MLVGRRSGVFPAKLTRRACLRALGRGAAASALPHVACSSVESSAAVLEVDEHRALVSIWSDADASGEVILETFDGTTMTRSFASFGETGAGVVRLDRLAAGTAYRAIVRVGGNEVFERAFVTAPAVDDARDVRIAVVADIDGSRDASLFAAIAGVDADITVSLGDWPYVDDSGQRDMSSPEKIVARHVEARSATQLQPWLERTSVRAIYDDHEVRNNWGGGDPTHPNQSNYDAALAIWDEFFPRHDIGSPRYRRWRWGAYVECFLLDTRRYRSPSDATDDASKTMLGAEQRDWLIEGVTRSVAPFKLVFSSVPLDFGHGTDHWAGYRFERDHILDAFAQAGTSGLLIVSGDQHWFAAHVHRHGVREFQIGPASSRIFAPPPIVPGVILRAPRRNFGLVDVGAAGLRFRSIGLGGRALYDETFTPEDLRVRKNYIWG